MNNDEPFDVLAAWLYYRKEVLRGKPKSESEQVAAFRAGYLAGGIDILATQARHDSYEKAREILNEECLPWMTQDEP